MYRARRDALAQARSHCSRAGVRAVLLSLAALGLTTAIPVGAALLMRSERAERIAGYFVGLTVASLTRAGDAGGSSGPLA